MRQSARRIMCCKVANALAAAASISSKRPTAASCWASSYISHLLSLVPTRHHGETECDAHDRKRSQQVRLTER